MQQQQQQLALADYQRIVRSFKLPQLRDCLKRLHQSHQGNKPHLQDRLLNYYHHDAETASQVVSSVNAELISATSFIYIPPPAPAAAPVPVPRAAPSLPRPSEVHSILARLQLDSQQQLMDDCRVLCVLPVNQVLPRENKMSSQALTMEEHAGLFVKPSATHQIRCRFAIYQSNTAQFSFPAIWPAGCALTIDGRRIFDTTLHAHFAPAPHPVPSIDISSYIRSQPPLPPPFVTVGFSVQRIAAHVQWFVVVFVQRKKSLARIESELLLRSPGLAAAQVRVRSFFNSDVACLDPITIKLRDAVCLKVIDRPVRTVTCKHLQCFDFLTHLEMNSEARNPKWRCPHCAQDASVSKLVLDFWFQQILVRRPANAYQAQVHPDGRIEYVEDEPYQSSSSEDEEDGPSPKRVQVVAIPLPSPQQPSVAIATALPIPPPPLAPPPPVVMAQTYTPRMGNTREEAILLLDDDDDLF